MPTLQELIDHPKTFLKRYALWPSGSFNVKTRGVPDTILWPVKLEPKPMTQCADKSGTAMPCLQIVESTSLGDMVPCYYLPYVPNQTREMTLGDKADLFFTDTMTGCSFGGMNGPNPRVAHLNYTIGGQEGAKIDQVKIGTEMTKVFGGAPDRRLAKGDYKTPNAPDGNVTVVGVRRKNGNWDFVYQRRNAEGANATSRLYRLVSVHTVR